MMECVKEETDPDSFTITPEDIEEQIDLVEIKEEDQVNNEVDDEHEDYSFIIEENSFSSSETDEKAPQESAGAKKSFACHLCDKSYTHKGQLNYHIRIHTGERPHACPYCEKTFVKNNQLKVHIGVHTGERPFSCPQCDKGFRTKLSLEGHIRVHTGEKPYSCPHCDKSFQSKSNLGSHIRIHTGEKRFTCLQCDKSFTQNSSLKTHIRIHTGQKPYSCHLCGKSYKQARSLKDHRCFTRMKNCDQCGQKIVSAAWLRSHQNARTGERPYLGSVCTC